jgi:hypothetical protein
VAHIGDMSRAYKSLIGKSEGKSLLESLRCTWLNLIKVDRK